LGLWLVQKYCGSDQALEVSHSLGFEMRGPIWQHIGYNQPTSVWSAHDGAC